MYFSQFGKKDKDDFSYVIITVLDPSGQGLGKVDDFDDDKKYEKYFNYYNSAPVSVFVVPDGSESIIQKYAKDHNKIFTFKVGKEAKAVLDAHSYCRSIHDAKFKDDVTKAFK